MPFFRRLLRPLAVEPLSVQVNGPLVCPLRGLHIAASGAESSQVIVGAGQVGLQTSASNRKKPPRLAEGHGGLFLAAIGVII
jgi:hypothetical protein